MKKFNRFAAAAMSAVMAASLLAGCSKSAESQAVTTAAEGSQAEETKAEEGGAEETEAPKEDDGELKEIYPRQRRFVLLGQHGRRRRQSS